MFSQEVAGEDVIKRMILPYYSKLSGESKSESIESIDILQ
jgi:hypothetical protein